MKITCGELARIKYATTFHSIGTRPGFLDFYYDPQDVPQFKNSVIPTNIGHALNEGAVFECWWRRAPVEKPL